MAEANHRRQPLGPRWTDEEIAILRREWPGPMLISELASLIGRTQESVGTKAQKLGIKRGTSHVYRVRAEKPDAVPSFEVGASFRALETAWRAAVESAR